MCLMNIPYLLDEYPICVLGLAMQETGALGARSEDFGTVPMLHYLAVR